MNIDLSPEAVEYGHSARQALAAAGEDRLALEAALKELGAWDLDPRGDADDLEAAAALCRAAGRAGIAYPVADRLAQSPQAVLPEVARPETARPELVPSSPLDALGLVLPCWTLLGMLDRAIELTLEHIRARQQFGQPLSQFQGVQFQLTDAEVERAGLDVLAKYALWSVQAGLPEAAQDALALRMAALEAAEIVFRVAHQLHGAMGFCDESPLSWLSRYSQPLRRQPFGLSVTRALLAQRIGRRGLTGLFNEDAAPGATVSEGTASEGTTAGAPLHRDPLRECRSREQRSMTDLEAFRREVRDWCATHVPPDWRATQAGASDAQFAAFQRWWFGELRAAGWAVPHWPARWGGGLPVAEQAVLHAELAAHDAPRLVLQFVAIHHAAATLLAAGTPEQRRRHLPAILEGEIWVQGFSEPEAGSDLASLRTAARRTEGGWLVSGQKLWASGAAHADWCLLLARTDPDAPKRKGISYFLLDMRTPGVEVRPIKNAVGESHFCEIFLTDVEIPAANLIGPQNAGWQVAQETLGAERGMTMLELAERLGQAGFRWLVQACADAGVLADSLVADRLATFETEIAALRGMTARLVGRHDTGAAGPADPSIVKLYYSELLQRMTDFGTEVSGLPAHAMLRKPASSGWESGAWLLDFIGSWEWTIPGGASEIQRTIIAERGLGLPRG